MQYGRTILEIIVAQAVILTAFLVAPVDLIDSFGATAAIIVSSAIAVSVSTVLYIRHRGRGSRSIARKLQTLRQLPAA